jgi:hypothetical protein
MTVAACESPRVGINPISNYFLPDTTQRLPLGCVVSADDPFWGGGLYVYGLAGATAIIPWAAVVFDINWKATAVANTANSGVPLAFALFPMAIGTYGWFKISGQTPVSSTASVAVGVAIGVVAAGQLGAQAAGKQVLNAQTIQAATATITKANAGTTNGSPLIKVSNSDGLFIGLAISGTGIPASSYIGSISSDGRTLTATQSDFATVQNATATGSVTLTGTMNDGTTYYNVLRINNPVVQGAIT